VGGRGSGKLGFPAGLLGRALRHQPEGLKSHKSADQQQKQECSTLATCRNSCPAELLGRVLRHQREER
jgi:hypothetical protein